MDRVRTLFIALVLVAGLGYLGVKGYVYYQVKSNLDEAIAKAGPFAQVEYGAISSSLSGGVSIEDVTVRAFADELRIAALELNTPDVLHLLRMVSDLGRGSPPEYLEVGVRQIDLALDGPLMNILDAAVQAKGPRLDGAPCGGRLVFGPTQLRDMGYSRVRSDLRVRIDGSSEQAGLGLQVHASTEDMASADLSVRVSGVRSLQRPPSAEDILLKRFEMIYRDQSYARRLVEYCARQGGTDVEGHIQAVLAADDRYFMHTWGVVPGDRLRAAYGRFLRQPGEVRIVAEPASPVELTNLHLYEADDVVALLNLQVSFNGEAVDRPQVRFRPELLQAGVGPGSAVTARPPRSGAATLSSPSRGSRPATLRFQPVNKADLRRYVGRTVRLVTAEQQREGVLMTSDRERAVVERRMYGGSMSVPVPMGEIQRAEVLLP